MASFQLQRGRWSVCVAGNTRAFGPKGSSTQATISEAANERNGQEWQDLSAPTGQGRGFLDGGTGGEENMIALIRIWRNESDSEEMDGPSLG